MDDPELELEQPELGSSAGLLFADPEDTQRRRPHRQARQEF